MIISLMWCDANEICFEQNFGISQFQFRNVHMLFKYSFFELFSPSLMCSEQNMAFLAHSGLVCQGCCVLTIAVVGTSSRLLTFLNFSSKTFTYIQQLESSNWTRFSRESCDVIRCQFWTKDKSLGP
jgi:hypothetical protein